MRTPHAVSIGILLLAAGCSTLRFDLASVPVPVSASPVPASTPSEPFTVTGKTVLWVHGLLGEKEADVAALVREAVGSAVGVANFRVTAAASFHDWFLTHLTLGLVRMKTVTVTGDRLVAKR